MMVVIENSLDTRLQLWLRQFPLSAAEVDCATTVMLKILDGKCKMAPDEKRVMRALYLAVRQLPGIELGEDIHNLIGYTRELDELGELDESIRLFIYEKRVLAESRISRPVMKTFKARIRQNGIFNCLDGADIAAPDGED
jgi:hypothetical protein